ncbi:hypothetical protein VHP8226_01587 [Vibrio hippocampi]|uniref:Uncharacterized protein n=1 Tax=Vibrio hippocampi TaxID=654686 RepID=A0ABM8ZHC9_9VIBR|nr:hypothetical protein VHP8226_01587 [Vibrio hippocampi]
MKTAESLHKTSNSRVKLCCDSVFYQLAGDIGSFIFPVSIESSNFF